MFAYLASLFCAAYRNCWGKATARRTIMAVAFLATAVFFGGFSFSQMLGNEREKAVSRYAFTSYHGLSKLNDRFNQGVLGLLTLSKLMSYYHPNPSAWPNITMLGFYDFTPELNKLTPLSDVGFIPIVKPRDLAGYESFMYDFFGFEPEDRSVHSVKKGLFAIDPSDANITYLDTTGDALLFNSTSKVLVPAFQFVFSENNNLGRLNLRTLSQPLYGSVIQHIAEVCSHKFNYTEAIRYCSWITESHFDHADEYDPRVTNFRSGIIQPIYLNKNSSLLVGFVGGGVNWQRILSSSFKGFKHLECVVTDDATSFTYHIGSDGAELKGIGDLHEESANPFQRKIRMTTTAMHESGAVPYTVHLYPTLQFFEQELTSTPHIVGAGVAVIILLIGAIALLNDVLVCREVARKAQEMEIKRKFVRFTSHEIRTPLNSVQLGLELFDAELRLLLDSLPRESLSPVPSPAVDRTTSGAISAALPFVRETVAGWQDLVADLRRNNESAVDVLNDLLNYDKIEMKVMRLDYSAVAIYPLVEKVTDGFQLQARRKAVHLNLSGSHWDAERAEEKTCEPEDYHNLVVIGDHSRLVQVMRNLLSNALKFTPTNGDVDVHVDWKPASMLDASTPSVSDEHRDLLELPRAGSVQVRVTDSGVGLSPEQLSQICSEGVQFNANQLQAGKGSGLGLFISKGLIQLHGGTFKVTSEGLGTGATFTMELPVFYKQTTLSGHQLLGSDSGASVTGDTRTSRPLFALPKRVLVVDDSDCNRKLLVRLLQSKGYECEQAEDGQRGIELHQALCADGKAVDVIVMDYEMPVMDGPTATKKLRELGCTCLIVGVTGNMFTDDVEYFQHQGANAVLGKPLDMKGFEELIEEAQESVVK